MTFFAGDTPELEQSVVDAFQAAYPNIKVKLEVLPWDGYFTTFETRLAGGTASDIIALNMENFTMFAALGALINLQPFIDDEGFDTTQYYDTALNFFKYEGDQYGLPATFSDVVLLYNKDLFDEVGEAYPTDDWTMDDIIEIGKELTKDTDEDGVVDQFGYARAWWPFHVWPYNGKILSDDYKECLLSETEAVKGLQQMVDLWLEYKIAPSPEQIQTLSDWDMWGMGKLAMYPIGPWAIGPFQDTEFDWDAIVHPGGTRKSTFLFSNCYAVTKDTKNPEEAWELIKFLTGAEGSTIRQKGGYEIAANKEASKYFKNPEMKPENDQAFLDAVEHAIPLPATEKWPEINDIVSKNLEYAERGEMTAEDAMIKACEGINEILTK